MNEYAQAMEDRAALAEQMIEASKEGHVSMADGLLRQDPSLAFCRDSVGQSPLMWAAYKGHAELASLLIKAGAPLDDHDCQSSRSALYMACEFGNWAVAALLLQHGADPSFRRQLYGRTCLQIAAYNNHAHVVQGVLRFAAFSSQGPGHCRVDINAVDNHGSTALHLAIRDDHLHPPFQATSAVLDISETVRILLQWGADPLLPDHTGGLPLAAAQRLGHMRCIALLANWERAALVHKARWCLREARLLEVEARAESAMLGPKEDGRRRRLWREAQQEGLASRAVTLFVQRRLYQPCLWAMPSIPVPSPSAWGPPVNGAWAQGGREGRREGGREGGKGGGGRPTKYLGIFGLPWGMSPDPSREWMRSGASRDDGIPSTGPPARPSVLPVLDRPCPPSAPPSVPPSVPPSPSHSFVWKRQREEGVSGAGACGREAQRGLEKDAMEVCGEGEEAARDLREKLVAYVVHEMSYDTLMMLRETFG
jgi:hypothetical protein